MRYNKGDVRVDFEAFEYHADGALRPASYQIAGSAEDGWTVEARGGRKLRFGPGYRLLRTRLCGVCSTDLARRFLPFPLPQITGHEVVAEAEDGRRYAVEINASCEARGLDLDCPFCAAGLERHCPERRVLGIHDLPGGFGPYLLAPVHAMRPIPDEIADESAVLIEPLAAAIHAVTTVRPAAGARVGVLGPRKLGLLCVAALDAWRRRQGVRFEILAIARRPELLELSRRVGADETFQVERGRELESEPPECDVVIDATGDPAGLELALRTARSEVHLKSTHGRPAVGMEHLTELVVDELNLGRFDPGRPPDALTGRERSVAAWIAAEPPPAELSARVDLVRSEDAAQAESHLHGFAPPDAIARADFAVVDSARAADEAIRPDPARETSPVRPRGWILFSGAVDGETSPLVRAIVDRGLRLTSSRCGDFDQAIEWMRTEARLCDLGRQVVTDRFGPAEVPEAFEAAASTGCVKAVVEQAGDAGQAAPGR